MSSLLKEVRRDGEREGGGGSEPMEEMLLYGLFATVSRLPLSVCCLSRTVFLALRAVAVWVPPLHGVRLTGVFGRGASLFLYD